MDGDDVHFRLVITGVIISLIIGIQCGILTAYSDRLDDPKPILDAMQTMPALSISSPPLCCLA